MPVVTCTELRGLVLRTRSRTWLQESLSATSISRIAGYPSSDKTYGIRLVGSETCTDKHPTEWHIWEGYKRGFIGRSRSPQAWRRYYQTLKFADSRNLGGTLQVSRNYYCNWDIPHVNERGKWTSSIQQGFVGSILPAQLGNLSFPQAYTLPSSNDELFAVGGVAIDRCRPKGSDLSLGVAVGELRDIPKLAGSTVFRKGMSPHSAGEEYLNWEFGIKPLIADLNDAVTAFEEADRLWAQVRRDAGRKIRRRYRFPQVKTSATTQSGLTYGWPYGPSSCYTSSGPPRRTLETTQDIWFSGCFRYALPTGPTNWDRYRREAARWRWCYGADVGPQTLYNLAPWTWLWDWFADMQPLVGWLSTTLLDEMSMQYGYLMEHKTEARTYSTTVNFVSGTTVRPRLTYVRETKRRVGASPYGFGMSWDGFTPRQLAILTALGLTRADFDRLD